MNNYAFLDIMVLYKRILAVLKVVTNADTTVLPIQSNQGESVRQ